MDLKKPITLIIFKDVSVSVFVSWWYVKFTMSSLLSEAFRHQLFAKARISCSMITVLQRERRLRSEIQLESSTLLHSGGNGF